AAEDRDARETPLPCEKPADRRDAADALGGDFAPRAGAHPESAPALPAVAANQCHQLLVQLAGELAALPRGRIFAARGAIQVGLVAQRVVVEDGNYQEIGVEVARLPR